MSDQPPLMGKRETFIKAIPLKDTDRMARLFRVVETAPEEQRIHYELRTGRSVLQLSHYGARLLACELVADLLNGQN